MGWSEHTFPGFERPLSSRVASVEVTLRYDTDGRLHHATLEARGINGNLLASEAAPASVVGPPGDIRLGWVARWFDRLERDYDLS